MAETFTGRRMAAALLLTISLLSLSLVAGAADQARIAKLSKKGEKIVKTFCKKELLPDPSGSADQLMKRVAASGACPPLSRSKLKAVASYLANGRGEDLSKSLTVPRGAKCPVCGMFVDKYPKWAASMVIDGKAYYFDGVKDMMKYYIFDADFPYDRKRIERMVVTDFYTLEAVPARECFYVRGSKLFGPMGNELVPFKSREEAESFLHDHQGQEIVRFGQITAEMVMALDGIEQK